MHGSCTMLVFFIFSIIFAAVNCCEPIREPLCQTGLAYNVTIFPNLAGHLFQGGAAVGLRNIRALIEQKCSPNIREFLCRVYMPECRNNKAVLPSWEMCQEAYEGCNSLMSSIGYSWAFSLNCSKFEASTIEAIKQRAADKSEFWFGTGVTSLCSAAHPTLACEKNARKGHTDSIVSRFSGNLDVSTVDILLQIDYKFNKGTVTACNNVFTLPGGNFQVDPLSPQVHHPWEVRSVPSITWSASPSQLFTLVLMNTMILSAQSPQAIYINIPGNNLLRSQTVLSYQTPMNPTEVANPYVFLLYEQNGRISSSQNLKNDPVGTIHASSQFKGLKAISWVKIQQDPYSISTLRTLGAINNCPSIVTEAAIRQKEPFMPSDLELEMSIDVTYTPSSITFTSCCKTYIYHETSFEVNPFSSTLMRTAHIRDSVIPSVTLTRREWAPNLTNFSGSDIYTLVMVDPKAGHGSHSNPYIHWMVLDIPNGNVNDGLTIREYHGPKPPANTGVHKYYFLLYKQSHHLNATSISAYTTTCSRCSFNINKFVTDNNLELVGATWMKTQNDEYIRHLHIDESSTDMTTECAGQPDYPQHCSSTTAKAQEIFG